VITQQFRLHKQKACDTLLLTEQLERYFFSFCLPVMARSEPMTYEERIRRERQQMSKSFAKLADFLLDSYVEASFMTASELAQALNLDAATVVRFSQHLGYKGFPQLQREIRSRVKKDLLIHPRQAQVHGSVQNVVATAMYELSRDLDQTRMSLDTDALSQLVERIGQARRIVLLADPPAQPAAYNLIYFLEQGGFTSYLARPGVDDLARTVHTATTQDLLIAVDVAGQSPYIARALNEARIKEIPTAAIVGTASLASSRAASIVLAARSRPSPGIGMIVVGAIIYALAEALRWHFSERFAGAEQAIGDLSQRIQQPSE
jgi:DNA-binding MurR/RpiR family transcriptional regulator